MSRNRRPKTHDRMTMSAMVPWFHAEPDGRQLVPFA
jgi:hypothetical protein